MLRVGYLSDKRDKESISERWYSDWAIEDYVTECHTVFPSTVWVSALSILNCDMDQVTQLIKSQVLNL